VLKSIRLKNFKLHEDTLIEAAPITVFIGPNNSGKSSIFQALLALRQAALRNSAQLFQPTQRQPTQPDQPYLFPADTSVDLGEFRDVVRPGGQEIQIMVDGNIHSQLARPRIKWGEIRFTVTVRDNLLISHHGRSQSPFGPFEWSWAAKSSSEPPRVAFNIDGFILGIGVSRDTFRLIQRFGYTYPGGVSPDLQAESVSKVEEVADFLGNAPLRLLNSLHPILPLRGFEEWGCPIAEPPRSGLDLLSVSDRAVALTNTVASDRRLKAALSERLEELLGIGIDFETVLPGKRLKIWAKPVEKGLPDTLLSNEGTGANQLPFILLPIALTPRNETVLLSEPEAHLHPKAQCELTRMLLTVAKKESIQFFIETHSEHVLHVILNSIGKREWEPSQVAIYSFENVKGAARVSRLEVDEQGGVKGGLPGFFDQSLDELTEYLETLKKPSAYDTTSCSTITLSISPSVPWTATTILMALRLASFKRSSRFAIHLSSMRSSGSGTSRYWTN